MRLDRLFIVLVQCSALFLAVPCGAAAGAQQTLNAPLAAPSGKFWDFQVTPDCGRVVFAAEQDHCFRAEVYSVPLDGSSSAVKLSGEYSGEQLFSYLLTPDGSRVVSVFDGRIMSAPSDGSTAAIQIATIGCATCDDAMFTYRLTPDGAHVLYCDNEYTEHPLYSAPLDGSAPPVRLSGVPTYGVSEYLGSPDGAYVAFASGGYLYGVPIDGSAPAVRLDPGLGTEPDLPPVIAPDGTVVFLAQPGVGGVGLYAAPIDGSAAPVLLCGPLVPGGSVGVFELLPDGSGAVYRADALQDGRDELFMAPIDGSAPPVLLSGSLVPGGSVGMFELLPGSSHVVYAADALQDGRNELFAAPLDASAPPQRLSHTLATGGEVQGFELTPDGKRAVYVAAEDGVKRLYSVPTDGSWRAIRLNGRLVAGGNVSSYRIDPDGRWVVYGADQRVDEKVELFSVPIDGSVRPRVRRLDEPLVRLLNVPLPATSSGVYWYAFAPEANRVLYRADVEGAERNALYSVPLRGGPSVRLNDELGPGGSLTIPTDQTSMTGLRAVFVVQQDYTTDTALLCVPFEGGTPLRLNPPLASGPPEGAVRAHRSSPDGSWTVYMADQEFLGVFELYSVPTQGGVPPVKLNGPLPYLGDVSGGGSESATPEADGSFEITPDGNRVVYIADQDVNDETELYVAPIDGLTPAVRLNSGAGVLPGLALDASSGRVVFLQRDAQLIVRLFSQSLDGSEPPVALTGSLVAGGNVDAFALTPDGTGVVFRSDAEVDQRFELYWVPIDGSAGRRRLSPTLGSSADVSTFTLTSDSRRVLFLANARVAQQFELYSTELLGGLPLELDPELVGTGRVRRFAPSPDGAWAVFVAAPSAAPPELHAVPCDGSAPPHRLNGPLVVGGAVRDEDGTFLVSPDSRRVVYLADQEIDGKIELYTARIQGSPQVRKLSDPLGSVSILRLRISHDSLRVFYVAQYPPLVGLFAVGIAGAAPPLLLNGPLASGGQVSFFDVDSVGQNALYLDEQSGLFFVPTDAVRPPYRIDPPPGSVTRASFTADPSRALYLQSYQHQFHYWIQVTDLHSFHLPTRSRYSGDSLEPFLR